MARGREREGDRADRVATFRRRAAGALAAGADEAELAALLEAAYLEGREASAPRRAPASREIRVDQLRHRTRDAFEILRALSGARLRNEMEPVVLVEEADVVGTIRVNLVRPKGWQDHSWPRATMAPLRDLGVLVPVAEGEATLTLSRRGVDLMVKDETTTDVPDLPAWDLRPVTHDPGPGVTP